MNSFLEFSAGTFFGVFPKQNGTVVSLCFLLEKHFITELRQRTLIFYISTRKNGFLYMWCPGDCLIIRKSGIGWNYYKSVLCQIVRGFLIGCHWIELFSCKRVIDWMWIPLSCGLWTRRSLEQDKILCVYDATRTCRLIIYSNFMKTQSYTTLCVLFILCCFATASSRLVRLYLGFWIDLRLVLVFVFYTCIFVM